MDLVLSFNNSANLLTDARQIIDKTKELAFRSVNVAMLQRNWYLGKRISEEILQGEDRAEYGSQVILQLSKELTDIYGKGFGKNNLYRNVQFFKLFPNIFPTLSGQSKLLTWSHYTLLLSISNDEAHTATGVVSSRTPPTMWAPPRKYSRTMQPILQFARKKKKKIG